jgi:hypothetical protein
MDVGFKRTGERQYAVWVRLPGRERQWMNPAPGYDDDIPHDLVHYVVEAALGFRAGVFGRAAAGGGSFTGGAGDATSPRKRARERRRQSRREGQLGSKDGAGEMRASERLAGICDVYFRRRRGQRPDPAREGPPPLSGEDAARVARVVAHLEALAPLWRRLPVGGALAFAWPSVEPSISEHAP